MTIECFVAPVKTPLKTSMSSKKIGWLEEKPFLLKRHPCLGDMSIFRGVKKGVVLTPHLGCPVAKIW